MSEIKMTSINRIEITIHGKKQIINLPNKIFIRDPREYYKANYISILQDILAGIGTLETTDEYIKRTGEMPKPEDTLFGYIFPVNLNDYPEYVNAEIGKEKFWATLSILGKYYKWQVEQEDNQDAEPRTTADS